LPGAGAMTLPGDIGFLEKLIAAAGGRVSAMSVRPDADAVLVI